ncbi:phosphatase PAP2 family protein [Microvirga sp. VF16]|uniref:phosphatase PAP2 family protein n=1 Tax=Microvirga sp. VF16 TaxID=2807101 RepID=UPI00193E2F30|nr:phosphatase PAP2 family protein [Microvirga sp. VF16]QRM34760.1 phosphatase PAP2 family protein [Microvirga sp. VF16]
MTSALIAPSHLVSKVGEGGQPHEIVPGMLVCAFLCLAVGAFKLAVVAATPLELHAGPQIALLGLGLVPAIGAMIYSRPVRHRPRMASLHFTVALVPFSALAFADLGHVVSYLSRHQPFADSLYIYVDAALGFDWMSMLEWANNHPSLTAVGYGAYVSAGFQSVTVPILLAALGRYHALSVSTVAVLLTLIITFLIAGLLPALGPYYVYGITPAHHPNLIIRAVDLHVAEIIGMRDGSILNVSRLAATGLVTFPSFHAANAVILAWALWHVPYLRSAGMILNGLMLVATPLQGSHYVIDVLAGAVNAALAIAAAPILLRGIERLWHQSEPVPRIHRPAEI